nr:uncharacterized protein LOC128686324 [Cherax quadricarinatus]
MVKCEGDATMVKCEGDATMVKCEGDATMVKCEGDATLIEGEGDGTVVKYKSNGTLVEYGSDGTMVECERRGSVTRLLQECVELYTPPTPLHHPPPHPDCWDEARRPLRQDKDKHLASTRLAKKPAPQTQTKTERKNVAEIPVGKEKTHPPITRVSNTSNAKKTTGDPVKKNTSKVTVGPGRPAAKKKTSSEKSGSKSVASTDQDTPLKPRPMAMGGCSGAYHRAVQEVRRVPPEDSVVQLGHPGDDHLILYQTPANHHAINTSSFTVAMAASKMRSLGQRKSVTSHHGVCVGPWDDDSDRTSLAPSTLGVRSVERPKPGRKLFEDAYVFTWSQPILTADSSDFTITFDKPKKVTTSNSAFIYREALNPHLVIQRLGDEG